MICCGFVSMNRKILDLIVNNIGMKQFLINFCSFLRVLSMISSEVANDALETACIDENEVKVYINNDEIIINDGFVVSSKLTFSVINTEELENNVRKLL